jgi:hypothetical protein
MMMSPRRVGLDRTPLTESVRLGLVLGVKFGAWTLVFTWLALEDEAMPDLLAGGLVERPRVGHPEHQRHPVHAVRRDDGQLRMQRRYTADHCARRDIHRWGSR